MAKCIEQVTVHLGRGESASVTRWSDRRILVEDMPEAPTIAQWRKLIAVLTPMLAKEKK
jgi:hypothetical protein